MITIDGSFGEGGGQVLRSSLALSLVTGQPFRISNIRSGRKNPGLLRQHLTAVTAAAAVGEADVTGAVIGSKELTFTPHRIKAGQYSFAVGTAGSTTLVLQTVLPALAIADAPSSIVLEGGTHNPFAPPFDFLEKAFLPLLKRMDVDVTATLHRYGFYPAGGGKLEFTIQPAKRLRPINLTDRGSIVTRQGRALVASLPAAIAEREAAVISRKLSWPRDGVEVGSVSNSAGPGNIVLIEIGSENVTEVFTAFGERGVAAEDVANAAVKAARRYLAAEVPVGEHLADQLMIPLAMARGGSFVTSALSRHSTTNIEVIHRFLDARLTVSELDDRKWLVNLKSP